MKVAIYGATGVTGALIAEALRDAELTLLGRDRGKLDALAARLGATAQVVQPGDLRGALEGVDVAIGCAGPFEQLGEPLLSAAIAAGADYLDVSGEQGFLKSMYERHEAAARHAGVCAVSGMAFEVAPGDLAAACAAAKVCGADDRGDDLLAIDDPLDEITVTYVLDRFAPTEGTARSARASLAGPGYVWRTGRWDVISPAAERRRIDAGPEHGGVRDATSFPSGEVITVPRHVAVQRVQTFASFERSGWFARATNLLSPALPLLSRVIPPGLAAALAEPDAPDPEARAAAKLTGRAATTFRVIATARRRGDEATVAIAGHDVYATTAAITSWAARALAPRTDGPTGVLAPSEAFAPRATLDALAIAAAMSITWY